MKFFALVVVVLCGVLLSAPGYADEITVQLKDTRIDQVAVAIATQGHLSIIFDKNVDASIKIPYINFQKQTPEHALMMFSAVTGLAMTYTVTPVPNSKFGGMPTYFFTKLSIGSLQELAQQTSSPPAIQPRKNLFFVEPCLEEKLVDEIGEANQQPLLHYSPDQH